MNLAVDQEGKSPEAVAEEFLQGQRSKVKEKEKVGATNEMSDPLYGSASATSSPGYWRPETPTTMYCLPLAM